MLIAVGAFCLVIAAGFLLRSEYEKEQLSEERMVIESRKIRKDHTILFLSDLHNHQFGEDNVRLLEAVDRINPDLILVGGDMLVSKGTAETSVPLKLMEKLAAKYPVIYGNGNHENRMCWERSVYGRQYETYTSRLKQLGVTVLENRTRHFGDDVAVTGIDLDPCYYRKFSREILTREEIQKKVGKADKERFQILLCHSPLYFRGCLDWGADLTLSGHFHGGTIRLPLLGGVMTPQYQFFHPYCAGFFEKDHKYMIVSRGLGTHSINIRLNNKPQLVVVDLKAKA
ncbi:metallophosphoesterase [Lacrimispora sp. JR3]|uniref:metallophosphoesterase n=1 Tax=Lacrimispora sinapis TaxID=3111456 RepID=UPI003749EF02